MMMMMTTKSPITMHKDLKCCHRGSKRGRKGTIVMPVVAEYYWKEE